MQVLQFIFENFWHFWGTVILLGVAIGGLATVFGGITDILRVTLARR